MNDREAMQALLDGERVRKPSWEACAYLYLKNGVVCNSFDNANPIEAVLILYPPEEWEIYQEPLSEEYLKGWRDALKSLTTEMGWDGGTLLMLPEHHGFFMKIITAMKKLKDGPMK